MAGGEWVKWTQVTCENAEGHFLKFRIEFEKEILKYECYKF